MVEIGSRSETAIVVAAAEGDKDGGGPGHLLFAHFPAKTCRRSDTRICRLVRGRPRNAQGRSSCPGLVRFGRIEDQPYACRSVLVWRALPSGGFSGRVGARSASSFARSDGLSSRLSVSVFCGA